MGREIRMVPPNWEHPKNLDMRGRFDYIPQFEGDYDADSREWIEGLRNFEPEEGSKYYWESDGNPPDRINYVDYGGRDCTWYQVYETVSEGTPVSPAFENKQDLINYLVTNGDFWDQKKGEGATYSRAAAEKFVNEDGWAPTFVSFGGKIMTGVEAAIKR